MIAKKGGAYVNRTDEHSPQVSGRRLTDRIMESATVEAMRDAAQRRDLAQFTPKV